VGFFRSLLGLYSYVFHGLFAIFLLGIALISLAGGSATFRFPILPWEGEALAYWLVGLSVTGILLVLLAMKGAMRQVFFFWSLLVLGLVLRGYFFSNYVFVPGTSQLTTALWLLLATLLAVVGAKLQSTTEPARR